ncbi:MAG: DUF169 domain-containing protein [bacterium]
MESSLKNDYYEFMNVLGVCKKPPLAAYYTNNKPNKYIGPKGGFYPDMHDINDFITGKVDVQDKRHHQCMFRFLVRTLNKGIPSVFDYDNFGCCGCRFYLGFVSNFPEFNRYYLSTGIPGFSAGEGFAPNPDKAQCFFGAPLEGRKPGGKYVVFERFENAQEENIDLIIFFADPEIISGLIGLVRFSSDNYDVIGTNFCAGCASVFSWPMKYKSMGKEMAELGTFDLVCRPFLAPKEMTLSIPYSLFKKVLGSYKNSFLTKKKEKKGPPNWWSFAKKRSKGMNTSFMFRIVTKFMASRK